MNICIPIDEDKGLQSRVCSHFGSAPAFMIVDTDSETCRAIPNSNQHHGHGMCMPLQALQGERIDGLIVGGIGMGALSKLSAANIRVYLSQHPTVAEAVATFKAGELQQMQPHMACAHHGHGQGHGQGGI
jgi:predicted Fe-Mo cluster-binding NifX family protein